MDRPEWIAIHPENNTVYVSLTNNKKRGELFKWVNAANPRAENLHGHILRWQEENDDPTATVFRWEIFMLAGSGQEDLTVSRNLRGNIKGDIFASPDGLWFDPDDRLWIQTDYGDSTERNRPMGLNQMLCANPETQEVKRFLTGPQVTAQGEESFAQLNPPSCVLLFYFSALLQEQHKYLSTDIQLIPEVTTEPIQLGAGPSHEKDTRRNAKQNLVEKKQNGGARFRSLSESEFTDFNTRMTSILQRIQQHLNDKPDLHLILVLDPASTFYDFQTVLTTPGSFNSRPHIYSNLFVSLFREIQQKEVQEGIKHQVHYDTHNLTLNKHIGLGLSFNFIKDNLGSVATGRRVVMVVLGSRPEDLPMIRPDRGIFSLISQEACAHLHQTYQQRLEQLYFHDDETPQSWWVLSIVPHKEVFTSYNAHAAESIDSPKVMGAGGRGLYKSMAKLLDQIEKTAFFTTAAE